jgi:NAD+ kinase
MLLVPNSAHALFARPLVLGPDSHVAVELRTGAEVIGIMWCDGRRHIDLPPGARIEVRRGIRPVRLARLTSAPFTDRLVAKFNLPVRGWRGDGSRARPTAGASLRSDLWIRSQPTGAGPAPRPAHRPAASDAREQTRADDVDDTHGAEGARP